MEEDWDSESFEAKIVVPTTPAVANKWEGEDEEEEVKESWEDEEEEKKDVEKIPEVKPKAKSKKTLEERLAEKEQLRQNELEKRLKEQDKELTPEEKLIEKLKAQKMQEESDLELAKETFGIDDKVLEVDATVPKTKEEFDELSDAISRKIQQYAALPEYPAFAEDLIRNICVAINSTDLKKIKATVDNMFFEKQKVEKNDKMKKNKGKGKAKLKMEDANAHMNEYSAYVDYDYDDFM